MLCTDAAAVEEQALLLALEAKKKAWLDELKVQMEQDLEVCCITVVPTMLL